MQIKTLQALRGDYGHAPKGATITVADKIGKSLIDRGLAEVAKAAKPEKPKPAEG